MKVTKKNAGSTRKMEAEIYSKSHFGINGGVGVNDGAGTFL